MFPGDPIKQKQNKPKRRFVRAARANSYARQKHTFAAHGKSVDKIVQLVQQTGINQWHTARYSPFSKSKRETKIVTEPSTLQPATSHISHLNFLQRPRLLLSILQRQVATWLVTVRVVLHAQGYWPTRFGAPSHLQVKIEINSIKIKINKKSGFCFKIEIEKSTESSFKAMKMYAWPWSLCTIPVWTPLEY